MKLTEHPLRAIGFAALALLSPFIVLWFVGCLVCNYLRGFVLGLRPSPFGLVAVALITSMMLAGCTPQQQQTTLQIVTEINTHIPEVVAGAQTVAATISALVPADAAVIGVADTAFTTGADLLQALTASYLKNPTASVLAQIQAAITTLEGQINTATLNATGIKNVALQNTVLAALKGLLTVVTVVFALIAPTMSALQLYGLRETDTIHLAKLRPYMDQRVLQQEADAQGVDLNRAFRLATAAGL